MDLDGRTGTSEGLIAGGDDGPGASRQAFEQPAPKMSRQSLSLQEGLADPPHSSCPACSSSPHGRAARVGRWSEWPIWAAYLAGKRLSGSSGSASQSFPAPCGSCPARSSRTWHRPRPQRGGSNPLLALPLPHPGFHGPGRKHSLASCPFHAPFPALRNSAPAVAAPGG
jgi:hypothetical protein